MVRRLISMKIGDVFARKQGMERIIAEQIIANLLKARK